MNCSGLHVITVLLSHYWEKPSLRVENKCSLCYSVIHTQRIMRVQICLLSVWLLDMRHFEDNNEYFSTVEVFYFRQYVICMFTYL